MPPPEPDPPGPVITVIATVMRILMVTPIMGLGVYLTIDEGMMGVVHVVPFGIAAAYLLRAVPD